MLFDDEYTVKYHVRAQVNTYTLDLLLAFPVFHPTPFLKRYSPFPPASGCRVREDEQVETAIELETMCAICSPWSVFGSTSDPASRSRGATSG